MNVYRQAFALITAIERVFLTVEVKTFFTFLKNPCHIFNVFQTFVFTFFQRFFKVKKSLHNK